MKREAGEMLVAVLLVSAFFGWRYCRSGEGHKSPSVSQQTGLAITADDLYTAYVTNAVAADERFKDQVLAVSGTVQGVAKYGRGSAVDLVTSNGRGVIQCYFEEDQNQAVATLRRRQQATIKCRADTFFEDTVLVKECVIQ